MSCSHQQLFHKVQNAQTQCPLPHADESSCCRGAGLTPEGEIVPAMPDPHCGTEEAPFQAVMVFSDPVDWYRDLQLITDVVMSG